MTKKQKILKLISTHKKAAWATTGIIGLSTFTAAAHFMTSGSNPVVPVKIPVVTNPEPKFSSGNGQKSKEPTASSSTSSNTSTDSGGSALSRSSHTTETNSTSSSTTTNTTGSTTSSSEGNGGSSSGGGSTTPPNSPPTAPTGATATIVTYNRVTIRVNRATDSDGIARHELLRNGSVVVTSTSTGNPVVLSDTSVVVGQTYTYAVRAVDALGAAGPNSNNVVVTVPPQDITAPTVPANFRLVSNVPGSVTFAWDSSTDDQTAQSDIWYILTSPLDESNLYTWTQINPRTLSWFDPGTINDVYIQAIDAAGNESAKAGPVTFTAQ